MAQRRFRRTLERDSNQKARPVRSVIHRLGCRLRFGREHSTCSQREMREQRCDCARVVCQGQLDVVLGSAPKCWLPPVLAKTTTKGESAGDNQITTVSRYSPNTLRIVSEISPTLAFASTAAIIRGMRLLPERAVSSTCW